MQGKAAPGKGHAHTECPAPGVVRAQQPKHSQTHAAGRCLAAQAPAAVAGAPAVPNCTAVSGVECNEIHALKEAERKEKKRTVLASYARPSDWHEHLS